MKIINGIARFFYTFVLIIIGFALIVVALHAVPKDRLLEIIDLVYITPNLRMIAGFAGLLLIAMSLLVIQLAMGRIRREKTIAFDNPDGQVTIALSAIENFMKGLNRQIPQIKELKPNITAGKKGIVINARVSLYSDTNIPNVTETIQSIVKSRVQDMLGIEDPITVKVHIVKILHKEEGKKKKKALEEKKEEVHYSGLEYSPE